MNLKAIGRWVSVGFFAIVIISIGAWFIYATISAWEAQTSAKVSCSFSLNQKLPFSYIQYNIKDQAVEPYFKGSIFINLGDIQTGPQRVEVQTTGEAPYGNSITHADFFRDEPNKQFWMRKESEEAPFYRTAGSHRDFPFDSATIDFDTTFNPALNLRFLMIRNLNPSFYLPCETVRITTDPTGKIHMTFEMRRNILVQFMAIVILIAATMFVLIIPFTVKRDSLPTSVASFFFSIWSIRGILSSEMKIFPTQLDIMILFLCVLLILLLGIRLLIQWARPLKT
jgi:hypothetical protein